MDEDDVLDLDELGSALEDRSDLAYDNDALDVALNELFGNDNSTELPTQTKLPSRYNTPQQNTLGLPESPPYSGSEPYSPSDSNKLLSPHSCSGTSSQSVCPTGQVPSPNQYQNPREIEAQRMMNQQHLQQALNEQHLQRQLQLQHQLKQQQMQQLLQQQNTASAGARVPHPGIPAFSQEVDMPPHYGMDPNSQFPHSKKRRYPGDPMLHHPSPASSNSASPPQHHVKQEPAIVPSCDYPDIDNAIDVAPSMLNGGTYQPIKWSPFQHNNWTPVGRSHGAYTTPVQVRTYKLDGDKGFNFSAGDKAFVCQKKNHFQITACFSLTERPQFIMTQEGPKPIDEDGLYLHFYGVKEEAPNQLVQIDQSQADRSKKKFSPVPLKLNSDNTWKVTVGRLHFSDTTLNNMRKRGKPNPDQRYFLLVVGVFAHCNGKEYPVIEQCSEKLIVRASNPGQFQDSESEPVKWLPGQNPNSMYHNGKVGINTDTPDEALTVAGNVKVMGHIVQPSDQRVKEDITEVDTKDQLKNVKQINLYNYKYTENFAKAAGIEDPDAIETGVLAQELEVVIPEAVKTTGDVVMENGEVVENLKVVDKSRLFMESLGAVKELCNVTDNLETKITYLERFNQKLARLKRFGSVRSIGSGVTDVSQLTSISALRHIDYRKEKLDREGAYPKKDSEKKSICSSRFLQILIVTLALVIVTCIGILVGLVAVDQKGKLNDEFTPRSFVGAFSSPVASTTTPFSNVANYCSTTYTKLLWGADCSSPDYVRGNGCSIHTCPEECAGTGDRNKINKPYGYNNTTTSVTVNLANTASGDTVGYHESQAISERVKRQTVRENLMDKIRLKVDSPIDYQIDNENCLDCEEPCAIRTDGTTDCSTYNFLVQVHSTFPRQNANIKIEAAVDGSALTVAHCANSLPRNPESCSDRTGAELTELDFFAPEARSLASPSLYPHTIGQYRYSLMVIRIAHSFPHSQNLCEANLTDDIIELNIWFKRTCRDCPEVDSKMVLLKDLTSVF